LEVIAVVNKRSVTYTVNIMLRLLVICLAVATLTALVYAVTKAPIEAGERARKEEAIRLIFPEADAFAEDGSIAGSGINAVYAVTDADGAPLGWCVDYTGTSDYGGDVNMMLGVSPAYRVIGVQIIAHAETFIDRYLDGDGRYTGVDEPRGADLSAGATMSYSAIRNAMEAVERAFGGMSPVEEAPAAPEAEHVRLLFPDAADWSTRTDLSGAGMTCAYTVKNGDGSPIGYVVPYAATGSYSGGAEMLVSVGTDGKVVNVLVLECADDLMDQYLDDGIYNGADKIVGASVPYRMIRSAIDNVEALKLGGAQ
jgi:Na+-translocating ferredoxin:NAD+ oxidoreductase RnfG subunit